MTTAGPGPILYLAVGLFIVILVTLVTIIITAVIRKRREE